MHVRLESKYNMMGLAIEDSYISSVAHLEIFSHIRVGKVYRC